MDKIQELHHKTVELWDTIEGVFEGQSKDHATITEDMMGKFVEWKEKNGYQGFTVYDVYGRIKPSWSNVPNVYHTTSELIQLFKQTL